MTLQRDCPREIEVDRVADVGRHVGVDADRAKLDRAAPFDVLGDTGDTGETIVEEAGPVVVRHRRIGGRPI
jgi:hypothetical protein